MTYQEFKTAIINYADKYQVTDYELYYTKSDETNVEIFQTEVKGFSTANNTGICFRCIIDGKTGYASTENLTDEEARSLVIRAIENAKSIESDAPSFIHKQGDTYLSCEKKERTAAEASALVDFALDLQQELYAQDERVANNSQSYAGSASFMTALYNSNGLDLENSGCFDYCYGIAIVNDGEEMYDGMHIKSGSLSEFDKKEIAKEAVNDALETIGSTSVPSGEYTVVFSNKVMANLLTTYASIFSAESAQKGLSLLKDKEGEMIASELITITDDPVYKDALVSSTFDAEGAATYTKNVVENGKFLTLLHNLTTAAKAGVKTTGNASKASYASPVGISPYNFYINPVKGSLEDLLEEAGNGIYITALEGMHAGANAITGDFSLSSNGFKIENGKKTAPIKEFTISGNFLQLMKDICVVGEDLKFRPSAFGSFRCGSPSVLVKGMKVAGK